MTGALYFLSAGKGEFFERALGPSFDQVALSLRTYYRREQTSLTLGEETLKSPTSPDGRQCTGTLAGRIEQTDFQHLAVVDTEE